MEINNNQATEISTGFNLKDFVIRYAKYLPLIILGLVISYYAAKIKLRYTTSMYNASGTMIIKAEKQAAGDKDVEDLFTSKSGNDLKTEIELMMSRKLMRRVVKSLNLQTKFSSKGKVKTSLLYESIPIDLEIVNNIDSGVGINFGIKIINNNQFEIEKVPGLINFGQEFKIQNKIVKVNKTSYFNSTNYVNQKLLLKWEPLESVSNTFINGIKINVLSDVTRILKISMTGENAKLCADVVNQLMEEYIRDNQESNLAVSKYTKAFIDERVSSLENDLKNIESNAKTFRENTKSINLDAQSTLYLSELNTAQKEFVKQGGLLITAKGVLNNFQKDVNVKDFAPPGLIDDVNLQNLFLQYNEAQFLRQRYLAEVATVEDKSYIEKTNDVKRIRLAIIGALTKIIAIAEMNKYNVEKTIVENVQKLKDIPGLQNELLNYGRNQKIVEELYLFLKKKGEEAGITKASTKSNSEVVDYALVNNFPISPIPGKTYSLAIFLGLLIPAAIAYIIELFNDKIRFRDDIEKQTKTPIIAEVGHNEEGKTLIVTSKSRKVIAEQFRMIRTNLQYLVGAKDKYTVLVTSSFSGEGKSFISTNVGAALSLTGKRTVILEFDLRKPKVIEGLGMTKSAGITNFVVGKSEIKDIIRPIPDYENLWVVGCGAIPPNPAELLLEDKIEELFTYLKANFDVIVIDSAPVGLVTDSMTLSKYADATLYIVRHKYTMKKQIRLIDELFVTGKLPKLSIVINDVVGSTGGYYGYGGYGYGYGRTYGYGYGYFDVSKRNRFKEAWQKIKGFLLFWK